MKLYLLYVLEWSSRSWAPKERLVWLPVWEGIFWGGGGGALVMCARKQILEERNVNILKFFGHVLHAALPTEATSDSGNFFVHLNDMDQCNKLSEVPTLPFWAEDLPLYVISPVLPFDRKISRWRKLKIFRSFYPFPNCPAIAFFIENSTIISIFSASQGHMSSEPINAQHPQLTGAVSKFYV